MSPHGAPHDGAVQRLTQLLVHAFADRGAVRIQSAFVADDGSVPEPDVAVAPLGDYDDEHPSEALLIVEVADTSLAKDRGIKAKLYAKCNVPEYWVVNLVDQIIEVHTEIVRNGYTSVVPYRKGESIRLHESAGVEIAASDVLR